MISFADCPTIREAVFQAIGAASACWDGEVFNSTAASEVAEALLARIEEEIDGHRGEGQD